jgi:asparagine synthase (glutamine-hydrolysing)
MAFGADAIGDEFGPAGERIQDRDGWAVLRNGDVPLPVTALQDVLVPALQRPPCVVAFSGGRDSALVLAGAVAAARREGLDEPVAVSIRFPNAPAADESHWQERVVRYLKLEHWERPEYPDGMDFIGARAQRVLLDHGLLFPPNSHLLGTVFELAGGGTVLSGVGGDEVFGAWVRRRLADVAARRARPRPKDALRLGVAVAPAPVARWARRRSSQSLSTAPVLPGLTEEGQRRFEATVGDNYSGVAERWDRHVLSAPYARSIRLGFRDAVRLATARGVAYRAPLVDAGFTAALARAGGWRGFGGRARTMRALFSGLLPEDLIARRDKAVFRDAFFTAQTRGFATRWSGDGLDPALVRPDRLRETWAAERVDYRSSLLLQSAWLHDARSAAP